MRARAFVVVAAVAAVPAWAGKPVRCYEAPGTMQQTCVDPTEVRVNGDLRAAPVYSGGPRGVSATGHTLVVNCAKKFATLQDRKGVNFAGAGTAETPAMRALTPLLCDAPKPKRDPGLRQF
jgi:hypothetical protein